MAVLQSLLTFIAACSVAIAAKNEDDDTNPLTDMGLTPAQLAQIMQYVYRHTSNANDFL